MPDLNHQLNIGNILMDPRTLTDAFEACYTISNPCALHTEYIVDTFGLVYETIRCRTTPS
jgi:hypothetical protein